MDTRPRLDPAVSALGPALVGPGRTPSDVRNLLRRLGRHDSLLQTIAAAPRPAARPARRQAVAAAV